MTDETKDSRLSREQIISEFDEMTVYMDSTLCVPAVRAVCAHGSATVDCDGNVHNLMGAFPDEKLAALKKWAALHRDEIISNHYRCGHSEFPLEPIRPWDGRNA